MTDFLLELLSEEIPARMQDRARADLARLFAEELGKSGLKAGAIETYANPRRLALIARDLPDVTEAVSEELKGPRAGAPPQALEGFLRKTGLARDALTERDGVLFAKIERPGRATLGVLAEAIPAIVRVFPWPKSMRWGAASISTESPRWVRPLQGIVALFGGDIVACEVAGIASGAETVGHRFHHPGRITIGGAQDYVEKLRACHVVVDQEERKAIIRDGANALAADAGLSLIEDEGLVTENAGLTEWPVPLLGGFDPAFLDVPPEVVTLTMRTNQKYFALRTSPERGGGPSPAEAMVEGQAGVQERTVPLHHASHGPPPRAGEVLAPNFICTANLAATDGGAKIAEGNAKVLAARLADARFFWEQDRKQTLAQHADKLKHIVFHEKLGTVADKVDRVAKLARWLVEEGIVGGSSPSSATNAVRVERSRDTTGADAEGPSTSLGTNGEGLQLANLAETAARLCKADLTTAMVGEFPELQGVMGGHYALAEGLDPRIAAAIRDHYKPVGQGDEVPTDPVTVAVSLADKLDTLVSFFSAELEPTGSKDPFALRRAGLAVLGLLLRNSIRANIRAVALEAYGFFDDQRFAESEELDATYRARYPELERGMTEEVALREEMVRVGYPEPLDYDSIPSRFDTTIVRLTGFLADRLKVQQREAGVRHDLIDAVFALGGEDDLVRLLARVKALQAFVETADGANLLAGYKRAANILKKEGWVQEESPATSRRPGPEPGQGLSPRPGEEGSLGPGRARADEKGADETILQHALAGPNGIPQTGEEDPLSQVEDLPDLTAPAKKPLSYTPEKSESDLVAALDSAEPTAVRAVEAEDFGAAMTALASLRAPIDRFFDEVTVNDPDPAKRAARLALLDRVRAAVHRVADFSKIEG